MLATDKQNSPRNYFRSWNLADPWRQVDKQRKLRTHLQPTGPCGNSQELSKVQPSICFQMMSQGTQSSERRFGPERGGTGS